MNLFSELNYQKILRETLRERKAWRKKMNLSALARHMGIQQPYLSKVLNGSAHLSEDQLFLACEFFEFGNTESHYLHLLLQLARTSVARRKQNLLSEIKEIQRRQASTRQFVSGQELGENPELLHAYYLDPLLQIIHVALTIEHFAKDPKRLARELGVSEQLVHQGVGKLLDMGVLAQEKDQVIVRIPNVHLPKDSPVFHSWQILVRQLGLQRKILYPHPHDYGFSAFFSTDEETRAEMQFQMLELIRDFEKKTVQSKPQVLYQIVLDLTPWTQNEHGTL